MTAILRGAPGFAVGKWLATNLARAVKLPKVRRDQSEALTPVQVGTPVAAGEAEAPVMGMAIPLTAGLGTHRRGVVGLGWSAADIRIKQAWVLGVGGQHLVEVYSHDIAERDGQAVVALGEIITTDLPK